MRVTKIRIDHWRNLQNIDLQIPSDATLVCLVGENGTGKSNILELISAAANQVGIASGLEIPRGDPFGEPHSVSITFDVADFDASPLRNIDIGFIQPGTRIEALRVSFKTG